MLGFLFHWAFTESAAFLLSLYTFFVVSGLVFIRVYGGLA